MQYLGTKLINATPMTRAQYNDFRGWQLPDDENGEDEGYLVEYTDPETKPNTEAYAGYVSWSPKDVFEYSYRRVDAIPFCLALEAVTQLGKQAARRGWNGVGMFIFLVPGSQFNVNRPPLLGIYEEGTPIQYRSHIDMKTADGSIVPWVASQTDILAEDWYIY